MGTEVACAVTARFPAAWHSVPQRLSLLAEAAQTRPGTSMKNVNVHFLNASLNYCLAFTVAQEVFRENVGPPSGAPHAQATPQGLGLATSLTVISVTPKIDHDVQYVKSQGLG